MSQNPFSDPYQSPQPLPTQYAQLAPGQKPGVWTWYCVYCAAMALLYLACLGFGLLMLAAPEEEVPDKYIMGIVLPIICLPLLVLYAAAPFLPRSKFAWFYGFATIGIGLTSCCTLPFSIGLLIYWLKPELKAYLNAL